MYTVSKGPSKIVAKTRRGLAQHYEKFEAIRESGKKAEIQSPEECVPKPVFQASKKSHLHSVKPAEEEVLSPQHEEIVKYINDSWNNIIVAHNPYDTGSSGNSSGASSATSSGNSSATTSPQTPSSPTPVYCVEPPSPILSDFKPFDLESWWGMRLFQNITKSL